MALVTRDSEDLDNVRGLRVRALQPIDVGSRVRSLASGFGRSVACGVPGGLCCQGRQDPRGPHVNRGAAPVGRGSHRLSVGH